MDYKVNLNKRETGLKIYNAIKKSKLTYEMVAEKLRLTSPRVIYDWVSGKKLPSLIRLLNLSELLNVHMEDLLVTE